MAEENKIEDKKEMQSANHGVRYLVTSRLKHYRQMQENTFNALTHSKIEELSVIEGYSNALTACKKRAKEMDIEVDDDGI